MVTKKRKRTLLFLASPPSKWYFNPIHVLLDLGSFPSNCLTVSPSSDLTRFAFCNNRRRQFCRSLFLYDTFTLDCKYKLSNFFYVQPKVLIEFFIIVKTFLSLLKHFFSQKKQKHLCHNILSVVNTFFNDAHTSVKRISVFRDVCEPSIY